MNDIKKVAEQLPDELKEAVAKHGFSKVAAAYYKAQGHAVGDEIGFEDAARIIGTQLFKHAAESRRINQGLDSLQQLVR